MPMHARDGRIRSDEGLRLETSAFELFTVANLQFQLGQYYQKTEQFIITFITTITKNLSFVHKKHWFVMYSHLEYKIYLYLV